MPTAANLITDFLQIIPASCRRAGSYTWCITSTCCCCARQRSLSGTCEPSCCPASWSTSRPSRRTPPTDGRWSFRWAIKFCRLVRLLSSEVDCYSVWLLQKVTIQRYFPLCSFMTVYLRMVSSFIGGWPIRRIVKQLFGLSIFAQLLAINWCFRWKS